MSFPFGVSARFANRSLTSGLVAAILLTSVFALSAQEDLADVIDRCEQSVVRIEVSSSEGESLGSGFIVESDGLLVTNVHVLAGAYKATAFFRSGNSYEIKGTYHIDEDRDICIAKIEAKDLKTLSLSSALPRKGEQVVALGSPHGLSFSASRGIVSAIRQQEEARQQLGRPNMKGTWIQVDAAISGGNSGGPLINNKGEVIGMSTLGSNSGAAQNLNFGISVNDIRSAIDSAKKARLVALKNGIGEVDMEEVAPESGELISRGEIPPAALEDYLERTKSQFDDLARDLRKAATDANKRLRQMRKGESYLPVQSNASVVVQVGRTTDRYFFRSESVKKREVARQQSLAAKLQEIRENLSRDENDSNSLLTLMMNGGPRLDPREVNKIGFMGDAIVVHAFNDHDVIIQYDGLPYLMWVKTTAGLAAGQRMAPAPVYVAGTKTVPIPGAGSQSLTILNSVMESEVREAVFGEESSVAANDVRIWTDSTGKFKIQAKLLEVKDGNVILEKNDGTTIKVPIDKLSPADQTLIKR